MYCIYGINQIDINTIYSLNYHALFDTHDTVWSIYFIDFPQVCLYVFAHLTLVWCQHFRTCRVQWRQFTKCSDPSVLWRLTTLVLLLQNSCFWSRIIDETLMFNCTPGLVISPLYRRVSTSGPLYCGYSQIFCEIKNEFDITLYLAVKHTDLLKWTTTWEWSIEQHIYFSEESK